MKTNRKHQWIVIFSFIIGSYLPFSTISLAQKTDTIRIKIPVAGMACQGCASHIQKKVSALPGVASVVANHETSSVVVVYNPKKSSEVHIKKAITTLGYVIGVSDPPVRYPKEADVKVLSKHGEDTNLSKHLAQGKITLVDFYADWCKPCKALDRRLAFLLTKNKERFALRKINIVSWDTPVSKHYLGKAPGLPYVKIYNKKGKLVSILSGEDVDKIEEVIENARKQ